MVETRDWHSLEQEAEQDGAGLLAGALGNAVEDPAPRDSGASADSGESLEEVRPMFQISPHDPPRKRVFGKSPPQPHDGLPSLRSLRAGTAFILA